FSDLEVTYGELDRAANRLAHRLRRLGVGRESRVGLMTGRGPELLVGLLGIWKAGGAYVPLDPGHPPERLAFLLEDAGIEVVVTEPELSGLLPGERVWTVALDGVASLAGESEERPEGERAEPGDLAYVIYTSGTTGRPKGVMAEHGNLAATLLASRLAFGWGRRDRIPALAPFSFDIFLFEVMSPLTAGGAVELVPLVPALDLDRLMTALGTATRLHAVPALMRQICALVRSGAARPGALKTLFVGGDAVPPDLLAEMREAFPGAEIRVLYGPTEGTIICSRWAVPEDGGSSGKAMLGRPLANVDLRIYDRQGGLALPGAPGELWIGGPGVTRGYLNRPDLTAEKFVTRDGRRWYRTGDLARLLPDGSLEFAGRVDQQVKVRGFRVEPGEIEACLAAHEAVREAVVLARDVEGGDKRLVAYVVPEGEIATEELRAWVGDALPEYMVPSLFVTLPELPVTAHGKVDKKALLALGTAEPAPVQGPADRTAPRRPAEEILARVWRGVLRVDEVGVHDNFFRLGGDSILSIQVVARARQEGLLLTPRQMFESQTIAALAAVAVPAQAEEEQGPVEGEAPLTPIQLRFFAEDRPEPGWFNQALLFEAREALDSARLKKAVAALVEHHDALRLRFLREDGRWRQVHAPVGEVPFFTRELPAGFDLETGPLFRAVLLEGSGTQRLLL
ncbi:MAG TPA: amino acid adenylation domain-containing protein, partial [Thermoanaerobaculia bacterium]|nr:amino acid adenylation domain-containing protein [Thermoanaerobaculia bacterium]